MKATIALVALTLVPAFVPAAAAVKVDPVGSYAIASASTPSGDAYTGTVDVRGRGDFYDVAWSLSNKEAFQGIGIVEGDVLGATWGVKGEYGVAIYTVKGGTLSGRWASSNSPGETGIERLEGPEGLEGTYAADGMFADRVRTYKGTVTIRKDGEGYRVSWNMPAGTYGGLGILDGNTLTVGWTPTQLGEVKGVASYRMAGGTLTGKWIPQVTTKPGSEVLKKR
jgi:hypothetical protein